MSSLSAEESEQAKRFKEAARAAECDEDEARWQDRLKAIAKQKPKNEPGEPK